MEASELRIGNLIEIIYRGGTVHLPPPIPFKITGIKRFHFEAYWDNGSPEYMQQPKEFHFSDAYPIYLDEVWLKRLGWKEMKDTDIDTWWKLGWIINKDADGKWFTVKGDKVILDYVHELQNLYFSITKKELTTE